MKAKFTVTLDLEDHPGKAYLREYVKEALYTWGGSRHPNDVMFDNIKTVAVGKIDIRGDKS